jgi:formate C-acetyltransferase
MEVQYDIVDIKTLRETQANPNTYRDLVIRIAGYSAYFIELNNDQQNDIIARHENTL